MTAVSDMGKPLDPTRTLKVAMVGLRSLEEGVGGVEKAVREVSTRLVKEGVDVTCYCRPRYNQRTELDGVNLHNTVTLYSKHLETALYALGAMIHAARSNVDVVHVHAMASSVFAWIPRWFGKKQVVVTVHGLDWQRAKWGWLASKILQAGEWSAVRFSHAVICVSMSLQVYFQMRYLRQLFFSIPNGCDPMSEEEVAVPEGFRSGKYVLYMGRLVPEKGAHRLIQAFRDLDTDMQLVIAGPVSHAEDYVRDLQEQAAGDKRIHLVGAVSGERKEQFLRHAYLFVLPSEIEGLPIALLEAASRGICPLVSSIPTAVEVLGDRAFARGFVVDPYSVPQLATALETAIENPELVETLGTIVREHVQERYHWDRIADQTLRVYRKVMEGAPS